MVRDYYNQNAVRVTHIPTGLQVIANCKRSLFENRDGCYKVLNAKIEALQKGIEQNNEVVRDYIETEENPYYHGGTGKVIDYRISDKVFDLREVLDVWNGEEFDNLLKCLQK